MDSTWRPGPCEYPPQISTRESTERLRLVALCVVSMSQTSIILKAIESSQQSGSPLSQLPRLLFSEDIARLSNLSITTVRHYTGNTEQFGHLLPRPWFKLPGVRRLAWFEKDVFAWINAGQAAAPSTKRRRGRPMKAEQLRVTKLAQRESPSIEVTKSGALLSRGEVRPATLVPLNQVTRSYPSPSSGGLGKISIKKNSKCSCLSSTFTSAGVAGRNRRH